MYVYTFVSENVDRTLCAARYATCTHTRKGLPIYLPLCLHGGKWPRVPKTTLHGIRTAARPCVCRPGYIPYQGGKRWQEVEERREGGRGSSLSLGSVPSSPSRRRTCSASALASFCPLLFCNYTKVVILLLAPKRRGCISLDSAITSTARLHRESESTVITLYSCLSRSTELSRSSRMLTNTNIYVYPSLFFPLALCACVCVCV